MDSAEAGEAVMRFMRKISSPAIGARAARRAARRSVAVLKRVTPVHDGLLAKAWRVRNTKEGAELINDAPYAGVIEMGARPHMPPWEPIIRWVAKKQGVPLTGYDLSVYGQAFPFGEVKGTRGRRKDFAIQWVVAMAKGLVDKIFAVGSEPKRFVHAQLPKLREIFAEEAVAVMREAAERMKKK